jgi:hypothetical protein
VEKLTLTNAVSYLQSMEPAELGLDGSSMTQYKIYAMDGTVFVDGSPCLKLKVCTAENEQGSVSIAGSYLLTSDKQHLYRLDEVQGTVEELQV